MARSAPVPCKSPGCPELLPSPGYCRTHKQPEKLSGVRHSRHNGDSLDHEHERPTAPRSGSRAPIYGTQRWRRLSRTFLAANPLCLPCHKAGEITPAVLTDHIEEIRDRPDLMWTSSNLQPLCRACHSYKTASAAARRKRQV